MPGGDRTGPVGLGPMTGWGAGHCSGYAGPGFMNTIPGRGSWGGGRRGGGGRGRGWRHRFYDTGLPGWQRASWSGLAFGGPWAHSMPYTHDFAPAMTKSQELDALKGQAKYFEDSLEEIRVRIGKLEPKSEE